ncbi:MAG: hypothetical protein PWP23_2300 [Candidatus Sumerlaeota bacterium]|nr:hypothetical protein [Candidatus Sumerlaeota bacterium]
MDTDGRLGPRIRVHQDLSFPYPWYAFPFAAHERRTPTATDYHG